VRLPILISLMSAYTLNVILGPLSREAIPSVMTPRFFPSQLTNFPNLKEVEVTELKPTRCPHDSGCSWPS